jgi:catechol 2,3-dioxygenase-like lactoylglutathione lyase family enzyme
MQQIDPVVTSDIYPMPAFVTLTVPDLERAVDWYVRGLDFVSLFTLPGPGGAPMLVHLRRWRYQDILVRPGEATPGGAWAPSLMAVAEDLPALAERARAHGGGTVEGPYDTPWNTRDLVATDPFGNRLVYTARRPDGERDEAFGARIEQLAREQGL